MSIPTQTLNILGKGESYLSNSPTFQQEKTTQVGIEKIKETNTQTDVDTGYLSNIPNNTFDKHLKGFEWKNIPMFSVITGKNGVGKTTLLKNIGKLSETLEYKELIPTSKCDDFIDSDYDIIVSKIEAYYYKDITEERSFSTQKIVKYAKQTLLNSVNRYRTEIESEHLSNPQLNHIYHHAFQLPEHQRADFLLSHSRVSPDQIFHLDTYIRQLLSLGFNIEVINKYLKSKRFKYEIQFLKFPIKIINQYMGYEDHEHTISFLKKYENLQTNPKVDVISIINKIYKKSCITNPIKLINGYLGYRNTDHIISFIEDNQSNNSYNSFNDDADSILDILREKLSQLNSTEAPEDIYSYAMKLFSASNPTPTEQINEHFGANVKNIYLALEKNLALLKVDLISACICSHKRKCTNLRFKHRKINICQGMLSSGEQLLVKSLLWIFHQEAIKEKLKLLNQNYYKGLNEYRLIELNLRSKMIFLLDEPDAHLQPELVKELLDSIEILVKDLHIQVLMTTHNPSTVAMVPEKNLYQMEQTAHNPVTIKSIKKRDAIRNLTSKFVHVHAPFKLFLVEARDDIAFYNLIHERLNLPRRITESCSIQFNTHGQNKKQIDADGDAGSGLVESFLKTFLKTGGDVFQDFLFGIIDDDNNGEIPYTNVFKIDRYSIENYLQDPIHLFFYMKNQGEEFFPYVKEITNEIKTKLNEAQKALLDKSFDEILASKEHRTTILQEIINCFSKRIREYLNHIIKQNNKKKHNYMLKHLTNERFKSCLSFDKEENFIEIKKDTSKIDFFYNGEPSASLDFPVFLLKIQGHTLEATCQNLFTKKGKSDKMEIGAMIGFFNGTNLPILIPKGLRALFVEKIYCSTLKNTAKQTTNTVQSRPPQEKDEKIEENKKPGQIIDRPRDISLLEIDRLREISLLKIDSTNLSQTLMTIFRIIGKFLIQNAGAIDSDYKYIFKVKTNPKKQRDSLAKIFKRLIVKTENLSGDQEKISKIKEKFKKQWEEVTGRKYQERKS